MGERTGTDGHSVLVTVQHATITNTLGDVAANDHFEMVNDEGELIPCDELESSLSTDISYCR